MCEGGVKWISFLLGSEHALLRNEGLVALNLLAVLNDGVCVCVRVCVFVMTEVHEQLALAPHVLLVVTIL